MEAIKISFDTYYFGLRRNGEIKISKERGGGKFG